jgi:predicted acetyltransferase
LRIQPSSADFAEPTPPDYSLTMISLRWVGESELDRVAETRLRCYAADAKELENYRKCIREDPISKPGDFLLAEDGDEAVGTATSLSFTTWVRGSPLPCQGVAWVGTIRTRRRKGDGGAEGIASKIMRETLRAGRARGEVISALMPFRASFYEHFGYGIVERRITWIVPLAILPTGLFDGFRFVRDEDRTAIAAGHQRSIERGQCGMERSAARWEHILRTQGEGFEIVDRPAADGPVRGYMEYSQFKQDGLDYLRVTSRFAEDAEAFAHQLHFLASLRDQYHSIAITLSADTPFNWLLKERQLPHRDVNHPTAIAKPYTRMQARILDHSRLLEAIHWPMDARGEAVIAVQECEGHISKFRVSVESGRASVRSSEASADIECADTTWAAIALGDLSASEALRWNLASATTPGAVTLLDALGTGPVPFCEEYF